MRLFKNILIPVIIFLTLIFLGAYAYQQVENWRYLDSVYFTIITVTTIGYGDFAPETDIGKIFTMIFPFVGIGLAFYFFSMVGRYLFRRQFYDKLLEEGRLTKNKGIERIKQIK